MTKCAAALLGKLVTSPDGSGMTIVKSAMIPIEVLPIITGLLYGGMRKKDPGEGRMRSIGRSGLTGLGTGAGIFGGSVLGAGTGAGLSLLLSKLQGHDKPRAMSRASKALGIGAALGAGVGGAYGYAKSKRKPQTEEKMSEKGAQWRTEHVFAAELGALAGRV